jgi:hypothetical protein
MQTTLIDQFVLPDASRDEFLEQTRLAQEFLKTLPGFVEGFVYERALSDGRVSLITTAVWESREAMERAKESAAANFKTVDFNPAAIMRRLGVQMERGIYRRSAY